MRGACRRLLCSISLFTFPLLGQPDPGAQRENRHRVQCAGNLKQIGLALGLYAARHDGRCPEELADLVRGKYPRMEALMVFVCPSTGTKAAGGPETFRGRDHCDYVYVGKGLRRRKDGQAATTVLAYEKNAVHRRLSDGGGKVGDVYRNVLFMDLRVRKCPGADASMRELAKANGWILPGQ